METIYIRQTELLLKVLPFINDAGVFALHGGTAINLFYDEMPRLSVDIDLTYIPIVNRDVDLDQIKANLDAISTKLKQIVPGIEVTKPNHFMGEFKLVCSWKGVQIKIEVNTINRGVIGEIKSKILCKTAQDRFDQFVEMKIVSMGQLFGGKMVAALDRQHPRDIFDTMRMLDKHDIDEELIEGFLFCLLSSSRPIHEILSPIFKDQKSAISTQFAGMTDIDFTYTKFEFERNRLLLAIIKALSENHIQFLKSVTENKPQWIYGDWSHFPGISWKLKNLRELEATNKVKFLDQIEFIQNIKTYYL